MLAVLIGIITIFCAIKDYDWFMNSSKAQFFVMVFGRDGARAFYVALGIFITILGIIMFFVV
ncbi:MAG: immunity 17 family protein [Candidatus Riflebacteria bacterium]|nr:immunity 17 family protein [Candidatus Riflebacteria bacterium]